MDAAPPRRDSGSSNRCYLKTFSVVFVGMLVVVALFNYWVDAYRLFDLLPEARITAVKVRPESNIAAIKLLNAVRADPTAVILGNSRADIGFRPGHPAWSSHRGRVYNLAVPGAGIQRVRNDFEVITRSGNVRLAVLALDFQDFVLNAERAGARPTSEPTDLDALLHRERFRALLTLTGLADSLSTLRAARQATVATLDSDGLNPLRDYVAIARHEGYPAMFNQRLSETANAFVRARKGIYPPGEKDSAEFAALRDILRLADERNVELRVLTYPYHAQYLVLFERLGLWPELERWKRAVLETVTDPGYPNPVRFWDFTVFSDASLTIVIDDDVDPSAAPHWYWEAGHFKPSLGDRVLEQVLGDSSDSRSIGRELTPTTVDEWLAFQREKLAAVLVTDQFADVRSVVARARPVSNGDLGFVQ
jgi:hypothetical protein